MPGENHPLTPFHTMGLSSTPKIYSSVADHALYECIMSVEDFNFQFLPRKTNRHVSGFEINLYSEVFVEFICGTSISVNFLEKSPW